MRRRKRSKRIRGVGGAGGDPIREAFVKWIVTIGNGIANDTNGLTSIPQRCFTTSNLVLEKI